MARISYGHRNQIFGPPCQRPSYVVLSAWNLNVVVHPLVRDRFLAAALLAAQQSTWVPKRIDSYVCRQIRGSNQYSLHSYGLAWDFFDQPFPEPVDVWGSTNAPDAAFRMAFADLGFVTGANFVTRKDYPHIEWADGLPALLPATTDTMGGMALLNSPLFHIEFVYDNDGRCQGYYFVSKTGEIHTFGDPEYVKYHGRSEAPPG